MHLVKFFTAALMSLVVIMNGTYVDAKELAPKNTVSTIEKNKAGYQTELKAERISIEYPQITNLSDKKKQEKINEIIKKEAMKIQSDFKANPGGSREIEMHYTVTRQDDQFLSIKYLAYAFVEGDVYPVTPIYTTTIDMKNAKLLTLNDIVLLDKSFLTQLKKGKYEKWSEDIDLEKEGILDARKDSYITNQLLDELKGKDAKFYLTKDALVVSVEVEHVIGHHMELAIDYKKLAGKIKAKEIL